MSLVKGRTMYAKLLSTLVPPPLLRNVPPPDAQSSEPSLSDACCQMSWVVFRNVRALFGPPTWITKQGLDLDQPALTAATSMIATKVQDVISTLETARDISLSFEALAKGDLHPSDRGSVTPEDLLLPFLPPSHNPLNPCPQWLENVLVGLLLKSKELGLENDPISLENVGKDTARRWQWAFDILYRAVTAHLQVLVQVITHLSHNRSHIVLTVKLWVLSPLFSWHCYTTCENAIDSRVLFACLILSIVCQCLFAELCQRHNIPRLLSLMTNHCWSEK